MVRDVKKSGERMVIVQLVGGLGNQMFQYATARAIAYRNQVPLRLDISQFQHYPDREYKLDHFSITASTISHEAVGFLTRQDHRSALRRFLYLIRNRLPLRAHSVLAQQHYHFDPSILEAPGNVYLTGYWQSEKYFKDIEPIVREELTVKNAPDAENRAMARLIAQTESVSLHVRRGDYVSKPATYQYHGVCSLEYYRSAVEKLRQKVKHPHFFVFSDDIPWAKQNLRLGFPTTHVEHNGLEKDYEDLRLMSQCKHHIIANSAFSWWGAWLCTRPGKLVIAPRKWFNKADCDTSDLIPASWSRV